MRFPSIFSFYRCKCCTYFIARWITCHQSILFVFCLVIPVTYFNCIAFIFVRNQTLETKCCNEPSQKGKSRLNFAHKTLEIYSCLGKIDSKNVTVIKPVIAFSNECFILKWFVYYFCIWLRIGHVKYSLPDIWYQKFPVARRRQTENVGYLSCDKAMNFSITKERSIFIH